MAAKFSSNATETLIERFIAGAQRVGIGFNMRGKLNPRSAEAQEIFNELRLIASELRQRKPILELRPLYSHENPDVRRWAAAHFNSIDPEWACAGTAGIEDDLTAAQVIELHNLALRPLPKKLSLQEMTTAALLAQFEDAATRQYGATFVTDARGLPKMGLRNRIVGEIHEIGTELMRRQALDGLLSMLGHRLWMVRYVAAVWCFPLAPRRAIPILESIKKMRPYDSEGIRAAEILAERDR